LLDCGTAFRFGCRGCSRRDGSGRWQVCISIGSYPCTSRRRCAGLIVKRPRGLVPRRSRCFRQRKTAPVCRLRARGSPSFLSSVALAIEGDGAPTRRMARIAPSGVRLAPDRGRETSRPAPCGAPTRHLRLTPPSAIGPRQELYVPGGLVPRPPVGQVCVDACPQVAAPGLRSQDAS
jgi:hypothetical protein